MSEPTKKRGLPAQAASGLDVEALVENFREGYALLLHHGHRPDDALGMMLLPCITFAPHLYPDGKWPKGAQRFRLATIQVVEIWVTRVPDIFRHAGFWPRVVTIGNTPIPPEVLENAALEAFVRWFAGPYNDALGDRPGARYENIRRLDEWSRAQARRQGLTSPEQARRVVQAAMLDCGWGDEDADAREQLERDSDAFFQEVVSRIGGLPFMHGEKGIRVSKRELKRALERAGLAEPRSRAKRPEAGSARRPVSLNAPVGEDGREVCDAVADDEYDDVLDALLAVEAIEATRVIETVIAERSALPVKRKNNVALRACRKHLAHLILCEVTGQEQVPQSEICATEGAQAAGLSRAVRDERASVLEDPRVRALISI